jgi:hypothetical protein
MFIISVLKKFYSFRSLTFFINILGLAGMIACKYGVPISDFKLMVNTKSADSLKPVPGLSVNIEINGAIGSGTTDTAGNCTLRILMKEDNSYQTLIHIRDLDSTKNGYFMNLDTTITFHPANTSYDFLVKRK